MCGIGKGGGKTIVACKYALSIDYIWYGIYLGILE